MSLKDVTEYNRIRDRTQRFNALSRDIVMPVLTLNAEASRIMRTPEDRILCRWMDQDIPQLIVIANLPETATAVVSRQPGDVLSLIDAGLTESQQQIVNVLRGVSKAEASDHSRRQAGTPSEYLLIGRYNAYPVFRIYVGMSVPSVFSRILMSSLHYAYRPTQSVFVAHSDAGAIREATDLHSVSLRPYLLMA